MNGTPPTKPDQPGHQGSGPAKVALSAGHHVTTGFLPSPAQPDAKQDPARARLGAVDQDHARKYLFARGYFHGLQLPEYFRPSGLDTINPPLTDRLAWTKPVYIDAPKGPHAWRRFALLHPYAFYSLVNVVTQPDAWHTIRAHLTRRTRVTAFTLPTLNLETSPSADGITGYGALETQILLTPPSYSHLAVADISNFYPSVYTHSIAWALHGKHTAKAARRDKNQLGNQLDAAFQAAHEGQTNGLLIGNACSDIASEIILADIDTTFMKALEIKKLDARAFRFRDDYRIVCRSQSDAQSILSTLSDILHQSYDLTLNDQKSGVYDNVLAGVTRPWKAAIREDATLSPVYFGPRDLPIRPHDLLPILEATYAVQRAFPEGRPAIMVLQKLVDRWHLGPSNSRRSRGKSTGGTTTVSAETIRRAAALLLRLMLLREDATPWAVVLMHELLTTAGLVARRDIIEFMLGALEGMEGTGFQGIWIHRLGLAADIDPPLPASVTNHPLMKMIQDPDRPAHELFPILDGTDPQALGDCTQFTLVDKTALREARNRPVPRSAINVFDSMTSS